MDDKMICLWREAFKIFHFLSSINISHRRDQNIFQFNMRNTNFNIQVNVPTCSNQIGSSLICYCLNFALCKSVIR